MDEPTAVGRMTAYSVEYLAREASRIARAHNGGRRVLGLRWEVHVHATGAILVAEYRRCGLPSDPVRTSEAL